MPLPIRARTSGNFPWVCDYPKLARPFIGPRFFIFRALKVAATFIAYFVDQERDGMMKFLQFLEPRSVSAAIVQFGIFVGLIACCNYLFFFVFDQDGMPPVQYALIHALMVGGVFVGFCIFIMTYQLKTIRHLHHKSRNDGLTGLKNRNTFLHIAQKCLDNSTGGVVVLLDADRFKRVNDEHGHQTGDRCLKSIAKTLRRNLRKTDVVGRIGGEEFAIFLSYTTIRQAKMIAERFTKPIIFTSATTGEPLEITMSVGAAEVMPDLTLDDILARADESLYQAKEAGRARLIVWQDGGDPEKLAATG